MSFGGGKSKSKESANSTQARDAFGLDTSVSGGQSGQFSTSNSMGQAWNQAMNQALSSGGSTTRAGSTDTSSTVANAINRGSTFVDQAQQPFLKQLYSEAMKTYQAQPNTVAMAQGIVNPLISGGQQSYKNLIGLSDPTSQIAAQEASLKSGLSDLFGQGKLGVNAAATNAGAFGGGRHGIEQAALGGEIAKAFTQGRGDIVANANNTALGAAQATGPLAQQLAALGMAPESQRFSGLQGLAGLLGDPTVLSQQMGSSGSRGSSLGSSYNIGDSFDTSRSFGTSGGGSYDLSSSLGAGKANNFANSLGINMEKARAQMNSQGTASENKFNLGFI